MIAVVSGPQVTRGVPKNNNASDHGNKNRLKYLVQTHAQFPRLRARLPSRITGNEECVISGDFCCVLNI
jgi:hypothetical protein